jgi:hypothetical protein
MHYRIDLVFYHRLLKCHVLIDLKMGKFTPADAGLAQPIFVSRYMTNLPSERELQGIIDEERRKSMVVKVN